MTRGMDFRNPILGEYTALSSLCLCQYPPEVSYGRSCNGILARKAQERARISLQMIHFCYYNTMETKIGRIFLQ